MSAGATAMRQFQIDPLPGTGSGSRYPGAMGRDFMNKRIGQALGLASIFVLTWGTSLSAQPIKWLPTLDPIPKGYAGPVFSPRFDFPSTAPEDTTPWLQFDFRIRITMAI